MIVRYILFFCITTLLALSVFVFNKLQTSSIVLPEKISEGYWLVLHRKSNTEELLFGKLGERKKSKLVRTFVVKTGIAYERPTPLPRLVGREYWLMINKEPIENPLTAPYFLTLDVPAPSEPPYGPSPYDECNDPISGAQDAQCNWITTGLFGLHGVNGDLSRLSEEDLGSSGCIRHSDRDITYLYNLLEPTKNEIRYYVEDN